MPLWKTPNVGEQPSLTLIRWRVLEISSGQCKGQRHLNGFCLENLEGRASTAIVSFDQLEGICVTRSGRRYHLKGSSAIDWDGDYVWQTWSQNTPTVDVSSEYEINKVNRDGFLDVLETVVGGMMEGRPFGYFASVIRYSPSLGWSICSKEDIPPEDFVDIEITLVTRLIYEDVGSGATPETLANRLTDEWIQKELLHPSQYSAIQE